MVMILLIPPLLVICLLYIAFRSAQERNPPYCTLISIVLAVVIASRAVFFVASVRADYYGKQEWRHEKRFFYRMFTDRLAASGSLQAAAEYMRTPEARERTLLCIRQIVRAFLPGTVVCLSLGGAVLLLAAGSLWCGRIAGKKPYPYLLLAAVLLGGGLLDTGLWYRTYAARSDHVLKVHLRLQQEFLMKDLAETETDLTVPEIIGIVEREAENLGFDHGQSLPNLLRKKEAGKQ